MRQHLPSGFHTGRDRRERLSHSCACVPTVTAPSSMKITCFISGKWYSRCEISSTTLSLAYSLQIAQAPRPPCARSSAENGIVQHQHRARMRQRSGQRQPLRLTAGQAHAAAAHHGLHALAPSRAPRRPARSCSGTAWRRPSSPQSTLASTGVVPKLRIVAEIADRRGDLPRRQSPTAPARRCGRSRHRAARTGTRVPASICRRPPGRSRR